MSEAQQIANRIEEIGAGKAFIASDFTDITNTRNAGNSLGRMWGQGKIAKAIRGVYYVPEYSALLEEYVPLGIDEVIGAIARSNKWIVAPAGDAALNALGLDTQVPAKITYVSSGPYKTYQYGSYSIEFKHRANRDLLECSEITCTLVQALKTLGKDRMDKGTIEVLTEKLTDEQISTLVQESRGLTSWVREFINELWEAKYGQNRACR